MFNNIKYLTFLVEAEINKSELNHKIHLPNLKELKINKISDLSYFFGQASIKIIEVSILDHIDYSMISKSINPKTL